MAHKQGLWRKTDLGVKFSTSQLSGIKTSYTEPLGCLSFLLPVKQGQHSGTVKIQTATSIKAVSTAEFDLSRCLLNHSGP